MLVTTRVTKYAGAKYFVWEGIHTWWGGTRMPVMRPKEEEVSLNLNFAVSQPASFCSPPISAPSTVVTGTHSHGQLLHGCWGLELSFF